MNEISIVPAVIAQTQAELDGMMEKISRHADTIQLDIMDGRFVPPYSLDFDFSLPLSPGHFEAHLMIADPLDWIERYSHKASTIIPHWESMTYPKKIIQTIKEKGCRAAVAINPDTPVSVLEPFLLMLDQVLIMTVYPGYYGSPFLPAMMDKIRAIRRINPDIRIEVDGGITPQTIRLPFQAGADTFVSGSYLVKAASLAENLQTLRQAIHNEHST